MEYTKQHREGLVDALNTLRGAIVEQDKVKGVELAISIIEERIEELENSKIDGHKEVAGNQIYEAVAED